MTSTPHGAKLLGNQTISHTKVEWRRAINQKITAAQARGLKKVGLNTNDLGYDRDSYVYDLTYMRVALVHKFSQNEQCKHALLETKGKLVYNRDEFWGIIDKLLYGEGINAMRENSGENQYGRLLVQIRDGSINLMA